MVGNTLWRYDIDGLHIDDYFYLSGTGTTDSDAGLFEADRRGFYNIGDWRRDNVNVSLKL